MPDDCMSTQIPLSVAGSESTHTNRLLTGISFFDFKNAGDHTPISPFTIMGKDFHLKCDKSVYIRTSTAEIALFRGPFLRSSPRSTGDMRAIQELSAPLPSRSAGLQVRRNERGQHVRAPHTHASIHRGFPYDCESIWPAALPNVYLDSSEFITLVFPGEYSHVLKLWVEKFSENITQTASSALCSFTIASVLNRHRSRCRWHGNSPSRTQPVFPFPRVTSQRQSGTAGASDYFTPHLSGDRFPGVVGYPEVP